MRPQAKPRVNFFAQVSIDTDERRRRLQQRTGYSVPRLVDEALRQLETNLDGDRDHPAPELADQKMRERPPSRAALRQLRRQDQVLRRGRVP